MTDTIGWREQRLAILVEARDRRGDYAGDLCVDASAGGAEVGPGGAAGEGDRLEPLWRGGGDVRLVSPGLPRDLVADDSCGVRVSAAAGAGDADLVDQRVGAIPAGGDLAGGGP